MSDVRPTRTLVLGLGNPLMSDDGIGLAALARLRDQWDLPPSVDLEDGGTWGMNLLPLIEDADRVLILDAIRLGAVPGTLHELERDELPRCLAHKLSPHQIDLKEVLALLELRGTLPSVTVALGLEPAVVALGTALSDPVQARVDALVGRAVKRLAGWGHPAQPAALVAPPAA